MADMSNRQHRSQAACCMAESLSAWSKAFSRCMPMSHCLLRLLANTRVHLLTRQAVSHCMMKVECEQWINDFNDTLALPSAKPSFKEMMGETKGKI